MELKRNKPARYKLQSTVLSKSVCLSTLNKTKEKDRTTSENAKKYFQEDNTKKRRWFSILLSWVSIFISVVQFSMFSSILQPFLKIFDPSVEKNFALWTLVVFSFGQMLTPPLFGLWSNKIKKCWPPIVFGLGVIIVGNVAFCCLEAFPVRMRKWAMLAIRFVTGLGAGVISVMRTYCATASAKSERSKAIAGSTAALGLSVIAGPGIQGLFSLIGYPGVYIGNFHLHMYNAPAFTSVLVIIVLTILNATLLLEKYPERELIKRPSGGYVGRPLPKYNKLGAWTLVWLYFCTWTALTNFVILGVVFTQVQFDWSLPQALLYNGGIFGGFAVMSFAVYILVAFHGSKVDERAVTIVGIMLMLIFYLLTYPWPGYPLPHTSSESSNDTYFNFNANISSNASSVICSYASGSWCYKTPRIPHILYLASIVLLAAGFPTVNSSLSLLLPKILGPRQQGFMQGIFVTSAGFARFLGPLLISYMFTTMGPQSAWGFTMALLVVGIISAVIFHRQMIPLNPNPKLKSGDFYSYKLGVVYRF